MGSNWSRFFEHLGTEGLADLEQRQQSVDRQLRDNGVTYNVYADEHSQQRPWALDLFPMIIGPDEWTQIEAGVVQRTRLLNLILQDIYGDKQLLRQAMLPAALIQGHPGYLRAMDGMRPAGDTWLHMAAFDLARGPDGQWWIVSQRTQAPSGLGYLLENRIVLGRHFPKAFEAMGVQRLAASYRAWIQGLSSCSPRGREARIALLTPGPYNETYFEHAYLARYLGLSLVEGSDLTVRDRRVYLKTLHGLEPVDILIKRMDDEWLDPLELRSDSALGVPGLMQAVRAGHVLLANAPGSAPLESHALLGFLPGISEKLLGEPLRLPSLATWWCGEEASLQRALPLLRQSVVKTTYPHQRMHAILGPILNDEQAASISHHVAQRPDEHTLQAYLPLSHNPTWHQGSIAPRPAMLRVFALADGPQSWRVLPGGMVRLAPKGQLIASMQRGGSSADCWVLASGEVDRTSVFQGAPSTLSLALEKRHITSRAAESLYWMGRYTERAENTLRLARIALRSLRGEESGAPSLQAWLAVCASHEGLILEDATELVSHPLSARTFERSLIAMLGADSGAFSVGYNLRALKLASNNVRERLSIEQRHLIEQLESDFSKLHTGKHFKHIASSEAIDALDRASAMLSALTGHQTDRMMRDDGWLMLSIGRHLERLGSLSRALAAAMETGCIFEEIGYEAVLALFDTTITFHAHYQQRRDMVALLELLMINRDNPRSLACVLSILRSRLSKLPASTADILSPLPDPASWDLIALSGAQSGHAGRQNAHLALIETLQACQSSGHEIAERIGHRYFSHADRLNRSLIL